MVDCLAVLPRPPAPVPLDAPLGPISTMRALHRNPIESWTKAHFYLPILIGPTILGTVAVVSDPAAIRRVFVDNAALQKRVLGEGLSDGLLEAEDEQWRMQRRTLAPLFTPKTVGSFAQPTNAAAEDLIARLLQFRDGRMVDTQVEMARVTLDVLGRTIFSDGLGRNLDEFASAISGYFATVGRLDPFDLLNFPEWVPRLSKLIGLHGPDELALRIERLRQAGILGKFDRLTCRHFAFHTLKLALDRGRAAANADLRLAQKLGPAEIAGVRQAQVAPAAAPRRAAVDALGEQLLPGRNPTCGVHCADGQKTDRRILDWPTHKHTGYNVLVVKAPTKH
jgi:Cytochrome P450